MSEPPDLNRQIAYQASHDALTGLFNRRGYERLVQMAMAKLQMADERHALCYLDLDGFKAVNDQCGHEAGDALLRSLAAEIRQAVPQSAWVARLGGDEFGILLNDCPLERARQIADDVMRAVADYCFVWNDKSLSVTVSVGLVEVARNSESMPDVIRHADTACFLAKKQGGGRVYVYSASDLADASERDESYWLQQLQAALEGGHFELHSRNLLWVDEPQTRGPQVRMRLWLKGLDDVAVARDEIVCAVEKYRLLPPVERWAVATSFATLARGAVKLSTGRSLAIRVSAQSLGEPAFLESVVDCLDSAGVAPERICFEVTEGSAIALDASGRRFISVLHALGCQFMLYVDGSGGPASFGVLKILPFDYIRVDGAVVDVQAADRPSAAGVRMLVEHARALGIVAVVEQGDVVAIAIDWEVGGEKVLGLKVHVDGSVQRIGNGSPSCEDPILYRGSTPEELLPAMLMGVGPEIFDRKGLTVLEPISGKLCKLSVHFWREHGDSQAFEIWYGSASAGPGPEISAFVANAIMRTNTWYAWMKKKQRTTSGWARADEGL